MEHREGEREKEGMKEKEKARIEGARAGGMENCNCTYNLEKEGV
jgi:hypothetical protein